jgi:hypothetical protein
LQFFTEWVACFREVVPTCSSQVMKRKKSVRGFQKKKFRRWQTAYILWPSCKLGRLSLGWSFFANGPNQRAESWNRFVFFFSFFDAFFIVLRSSTSKVCRLQCIRLVVSALDPTTSVPCCSTSGVQVRQTRKTNNVEHNWKH